MAYLYVKSVEVGHYQYYQHVIYLYSFLILNFFFIIYFLGLLLYNYFSDTIVSDYPNYFFRFLLIYNIISNTYNARTIAKTLIDVESTIETIQHIYPAATWYERESWDLYGVYYYNNLDLRRIVNDYGFFGHPFRKDFPLSGFYEQSFFNMLGILTKQFIKIHQEFRFFCRTFSWKQYPLS
jgi:NADH:ubiquinone oxidoreductase subunit C